MSVSQTHFQNAQNVQVHNGQFFNIANAHSTTIINNPTNNDPISTILWPHVAAGAIFDSAERFAAGKCHPGTRKKVIERIIDWVADTNPTHVILWLYGPAGAGKSAVAHTICELLKEQHPDRYGGSFFFASGLTDRGNAFKLFTTLSYQLAIQLPFMRSEINAAVSHDPSLPTKSMEIQFLSLIAQPLLNCRSFLSHNPILLIDGLDECADDQGMDIQRNIISLIAKFIVEYDLPLRVMVASRPEYWIRDAFDTAPLPSITRVLCLRDDEDADKDIEAYLINGFEKIRVENKRVMEDVVLPWPPLRIIKRFVEEASGQYVYAATLLKFVGKSSRFINPQDQLVIIVSPGPHRKSAFSELDRLYTTVLSAYPRWETMKRVLEGLLIGANTTIIKVVLGVNSSELVLVLDALGALIDIKKPEPPPEDHLFLESMFGPLLAGQDKISFCHRSFLEFLGDETRSGVFHIDLDAVRLEIVQAFFDIIHRNIDQNYEIEPSIFVNIDHFTYHDILQRTTTNCIHHCSADILVPLLTCTAERMMSYSAGSESLDSLLYFTQDVEHIYYLLRLLFLRERNEENKAAYVNLEAAVRLVQQRALQALSMCSTFKVTPTLVYLAEYDDSRGTFVHNLFTVPGTTDGISTIRQHRHFLRLSYFHDDNDWSFKSMNLSVIRQDEGLRFQDEWKDQLKFLVYHYLKIILDQLPATINGCINDAYFLKYRFFNSRRISDISTKEYFQNPHNLSILALMTDTAAWTFTLQNRRLEDILTVPLLCWFNRQLTNLQNLRLSHDYDETLQQKMTATMQLIFDQKQQCISYKVTSVLGPRPPMDFFHKELRTFTSYALGHFTMKSIALEVMPLPQGFHLREDQEDSSLAYNEWDLGDWCIFHREIFGETPDATIEGSKNRVIDPLCWHPHFASRLLNALARFLYGKSHPAFSTANGYQSSFPYLIQCLPYAEPTAGNLDALRAIVYLYPQMTPAWNPPEGFWILVMEFLKKYDSSVLSSEELDLFMIWLQSTDHADIGTYIEH